VNSSHNFSVFNLLTIYNQRLSQARVAYFRICRYFLDLLKICEFMCQCNVFGIYVYSVRQLKETLVHCSIWMGWRNL